MELKGIEKGDMIMGECHKKFFSWQQMSPKWHFMVSSIVSIPQSHDDDDDDDDELFLRYG